MQSKQVTQYSQLKKSILSTLSWQIARNSMPCERANCTQGRVAGCVNTIHADLYKCDVSSPLKAAAMYTNTKMVNPKDVAMVKTLAARRLFSVGVAAGKQTSSGLAFDIQHSG